MLLKKKVQRPEYHLYPHIDLNHRHRVSGEVEKNSFIALPGKRGPQQANVLKTMCSDLEG